MSMCESQILSYAKDMPAGKNKFLLTNSEFIILAKIEKDRVLSFKDNNMVAVTPRYVKEENSLYIRVELLNKINCVEDCLYFSIDFNDSTLVEDIKEISEYELLFYLYLVSNDLSEISTKRIFSNPKSIKSLKSQISLSGI